MTEEGTYASNMNTVLCMLGWYRNSLNCLQGLDLSSWVQMSEEVGEAPLSKLLAQRHSFQYSLLFSCEDNNIYNIGKMVHLTEAFSSKGPQCTLNTEQGNDNLPSIWSACEFTVTESYNQQLSSCCF